MEKYIARASVSLLSLSGSNRQDSWFEQYMLQWERASLRESQDSLFLCLAWRVWGVKKEERRLGKELRCF